MGFVVFLQNIEKVRDIENFRTIALLATQNRAGGSGTSRGQLTQEKRLAAAAALDR